MLMMLQEIPAWLGVLVAACGMIACAASIGRTSWAGVLAGGFFGEAVGMAFPRLAVWAVRGSVMTMASIGPALVISSLIGLAGRVAVVGGVVGLLSELRNAAGHGEKKG